MDSLDLRIAIMELKEKGRLPVPDCTAEQVCDRLGLPPEKLLSVGIALRRLGFRKVSPQKTRRKGENTVKIPALWEPPQHFPAAAIMERQLRNRGLNTGQVQRGMSAGHKDAQILEDALRELLIDRVDIDKRGALKRAIDKTVVDTIAKLRDNYFTHSEVALWIGESPDANPAAIEHRIRGLAKFSNRRPPKRSS